MKRCCSKLDLFFKTPKWSGTEKCILQILFVVLMSFPMLLAGCERDSSTYYGDYPEAYTMGINHLICAYGSESVSCWLIEQDHYGRGLYLYLDYGVDSEANGRRCAILVSQKVNNGSVYFYPDYNFISAPTNVEWEMENDSEERYLNRLLMTISKNEIAGLKSLNDWNKPFDESKCISLEIARKSRERLVEDKNYIPFLEPYGLVKKSKIINFYRMICPTSPKDVIYVYLTSDNYDRHIYFVFGRTLIRDPDPVFIYSQNYVMLFNPDGSYDSENGWLEMTDLYNYQDELKAFKERNHWNEPL